VQMDQSLAWAHTPDTRASHSVLTWSSLAGLGGGRWQLRGNGTMLWLCRSRDMGRQAMHCAGCAASRHHFLPACSGVHQHRSQRSTCQMRCSTCRHHVTKGECEWGHKWHSCPAQVSCKRRRRIDPTSGPLSKFQSQARPLSGKRPKAPPMRAFRHNTRFLFRLMPMRNTGRHRVSDYTSI